MEFRRQTTRRLHEEHEASFDACTRLEQALTARARGGAPEAGDPQWGSLARGLDAELGAEVLRHFDFEERSLFPLLEEGGEGDIAALLVEEHETIRECAGQLMPLLAQSCGAGVDAREWQALTMLGMELTERLVAHAQKEEMALLPALEDLLDDERDSELFGAYVLS
jgi:hemerythrin-like domain-containing protein